MSARVCIPPQVRLGVSVHYNPFSKETESKVGVHLQIGHAPRKQSANSPCLVHETIFQM